MNNEYARLLFDYNAWANKLVLDKAAEVSDADYFATVDGLSFGSLHATLLHTLGAERGWVARWRGDVAPERLNPENTPNLATLREHWVGEEERQHAFLAGLSGEQVAGPVSFSLRDGPTETQPLWAMIAHVVNHGTQFRSEASVRLTQLGLSPGDVDMFFYVRQLS